jgi:hypothetical protein
MNLFIILLIFRLVLTLRPSDFCNLNTKNCIGRFGSKNVYTEECEYDKCQSNYSYHCANTTKCSRSKKECDEYFEMNKIFNTDSYIRHAFAYIWQSSEKRRKNFAKNFNATMSKVKYCRNDTFKPSDICLNKRNCFKLKLNVTFTRVECLCIGNFSFKCGKNYCARNKTSCKSYQNKYKILSRLGSTSIGVKPCKNSIFSLNA